MVERVSGYDGVELVVGEHEPATAPGDRAPRRHARPPRARASRCSTSSAGGTSSGSTSWSTGGCSCPRPETEVVAQHRDRGGRRARRAAGPPRPVGAAARPSFAVADLGTGSGAIALALGARAPRRRGLGDRRERRRARGRARANLAGAGSVGDAGAPRARVVVRRAARSSSRGRLRLVVSNPPYVAEHEVPDLPRRRRRLGAPRRAGERALRARGIETIVRDAPEWLDPAGSVLVVELAPHQAAAARRARDHRRVRRPSTSSPTSPAATACSSPGWAWLARFQVWPTSSTSTR